MERFSPQAVDLAAVARMLVDTCGPTVAGAVIGRTRFRDEVVCFLGCSQLEAEQVVDTMVGRGFLRKRESPGTVVFWEVDLTNT